MSPLREDEIVRDNMAMAAAIAHFSSTPWCHSLISDPAWVITNIPSRTPKSTTEDSFFAETLSSDRTIRHCLILRPAVARDDGLAFVEVRTIMELGNGLNGHPNIAHGGFIATMMDEVLGQLIYLGGSTYFTAYLNTTYKKPVPTPGILLCTAKVDRVDKNKIYCSGTVEDGNGTVYSTGEGLFIEVKPKL